MLPTQAEAKDMTLVEREVRWVATLEGRLDKLAMATTIAAGRGVRQAYLFAWAAHSPVGAAEIGWILANPLKKSEAAGSVAA